MFLILAQFPALLRDSAQVKLDPVQSDPIRLPEPLNNDVRTLASWCVDYTFSKQNIQKFGHFHIGGKKQRFNKQVDVCVEFKDRNYPEGIAIRQSC